VASKKERRLERKELTTQREVDSVDHVRELPEVLVQESPSVCCAVRVAVDGDLAALRTAHPGIADVES
jgi:hypothetical protein